jgi:hypothetical protein
LSAKAEVACGYLGEHFDERGTALRDEPDAALGTGMLWAFARDMQVDLGTYVGVHGDEPVATPVVGFSVRR